MKTESYLQIALTLFAFLSFIVFVTPKCFSWDIRNGYFNTYFLGILFNRVKIENIRNTKIYSFFNLPTNSIYYAMNSNIYAYFFGKTLVIEADGFHRFYTFFSLESEKIQAALEAAIKDRLEVDV